VASVRDEARQKTIKTFEARGANVLEVASALARQIAPQPKPYTSSNPDAVRELYSRNPEKAIALDPQYGAAHLTLIDQFLRAGKREEAASAIAAARSAKFTELERAQFDAITATTPSAQSAAWLTAARIARHDFSLWRTAGDAAMNVKDHRGAVEAYTKVTEIESDNVAGWNILAYAQAFAGDLEAAKRSLARYRELSPKDPNAYDSMGEIYFYEGRFREAEEQFLRAFDMDNARLGGAEAYRAGLAAFVAGDKAKAEGNFNKYLQIQKKTGDAQSAALRESIWLYSTGRAKEARERAMAVTTPVAKMQLQLWDAVDRKAPTAFGDQPAFAGWKLYASGRYAEAAEYWNRIYTANSLINGNESRVMLAATLHEQNRSDEARKLLAKWPLPPTGADPGFSSVVFAKALALKAGGR
jgi:tetratricopeptide (TPR) repeat protein